VILDLGANHGCFSRQLSERHGGTYYLVEANPLLGEKLASDGWRSVMQCAVAAEPGRLQFNLALNDEGSSILPLPAESPYGCMLRDSVEVEARTLESILNELALPQIDLLKIDIEGAEVPVLETLPPAILRRFGQMCVEFHCEPAFRFGLKDRVEKVILQLERQGFVCLDFTYLPGEVRCDVLFLNKALHRLSHLQCLWWKLRVPPARWAKRWLSTIRRRLPVPLQRLIYRLRNRDHQLLQAATGPAAK
jgi:FkbM family methyltransferase